jgi:PAS domain S-box-containing protein
MTTSKSKSVARSTSGRRRSRPVPSSIEALRLSEEKFAKVFAASLDAILLTSLADGRCLEVNDACLEMLGYAREEVIGRTTLELNIWPDDMARVKFVSQVQSAGRIRRQEVAFRHRSGQLRLALASAEIIDIGGEPCLLVIAEDITERERLAQELAQQMRMLNALMSATPEHFHLHDREGRYLFASPAALRAVGRSAADVLGKTWRDLGFAEEAGREFENRLQQVFTTGDTVKTEVQIEMSDGPRWYEQTLSPVRDEDGQVAMAVSTVHDITDRKAFEEALARYAADLQIRNEELDAFAHTVAHDLKSPLGNIMGFAEWLQARPDMPAEVRQDYINIIARNAFKMDSIIDELLLLARVRKGDVEYQPVDMGRVVSEATHRLTFMIAESHAALHAPEHWPVAMGHAPWIEEVWVNYLSNAIKHGGRPPRVELGAELRPDDTVRCWVKDNGPGINPEARERLFTPFTRLSEVRATGDGLGLSIVRHIVEKMGGAVGFDSAGDCGSLFWFTLPAAQ